MQSSANLWNSQEIPDMLGTLYSFTVDKIDVLVVTPLVTLCLILDPTRPHFPSTIIPHRCCTEGLELTDPKSVRLDDWTGHKEESCYAE